MDDATLCAMMEFDRRIDTRTLEESALACLRAHPVLYSRLVWGNGPAFWEMIEDVRVSPVRVEECDRDYHSHVIGPFDPYGRCSFAYGCCKDHRVI